MDNVALLIALTLAYAGLLTGLGFLRYWKRGLFLDPLNSHLFNLAMYFVVQVPFILFPGNTYMIGAGYQDLWPQIWSCFGIEVLFSTLTVVTCLFLSSSYVKADLDILPRRIISAASLLLSAHRLYLLFLIPVVAILVIFVAKYGAALLLVDSMGAAKARTMILREGAEFRALFNFASMALSTLLFYMCVLSVKFFQDRQYSRLLSTLLLFLLGCGGAFVITGTRTFALDPISGIITTALMFSLKHNKPTKVLGAAFFLVLTASAMDILRSGGAGFYLFDIFVKGNSFADFRDFVWSFKGFHDRNMDFWMGRTYLSSWISFIPSSFMPFREEWAYGRAVMRLVGWSTEDHYGIRSGMAGPIYYNGGMGLVVIMGVLFGVIIFMQQRLFQLLFGSGGSLFGKLMVLFIGNKLLSLCFFFLDNKSLWVLYVNILIFVLCFLAYPLIRLRTRVDNREFRNLFR